MEDDLNFRVKWKTTSIFGSLEDDLTFMVNGRKAGKQVTVFVSREISGFRYFVKMVSNCKMEKLKYAGHDVTIVSIAQDDEHIEAHKICLRKQRNCGIWHSAGITKLVLRK